MTDRQPFQLVLILNNKIKRLSSFLTHYNNVFNNSIRIIKNWFIVRSNPIEILKWIRSDWLL